MTKVPMITSAKKMDTNITTGAKLTIINLIKVGRPIIMTRSHKRGLCWFFTLGWFSYLHTH